MQQLGQELLRSIFADYTEVEGSTTTKHQPTMTECYDMTNPYFASVVPLQKELMSKTNQLEQLLLFSSQYSNVLRKHQHLLKMSIESWQQNLVVLAFTSWVALLRIRQAQRKKLRRIRQKIWFTAWVKRVPTGEDAGNNEGKFLKMKEQYRGKCREVERLMSRSMRLIQGLKEMGLEGLIEETRTMVLVSPSKRVDKEPAGGKKAEKGKVQDVHHHHYTRREVQREGADPNNNGGHTVGHKDLELLLQVNAFYRL
jgi:hypothetical protein